MNLIAGTLLALAALDGHAPTNDAADLGQAGGDYAWRPVAGAHQLALVDADAKIIAATRFQVRGYTQ